TAAAARRPIPRLRRCDSRRRLFGDAHCHRRNPACIARDEKTVAGKLRGADLLSSGCADAGDEPVFSTRPGRFVADGQRSVSVLTAKKAPFTRCSATGCRCQRRLQNDLGESRIHDKESRRFAPLRTSHTRRPARSDRALYGHARSRRCAAEGWGSFRAYSSGGNVFHGRPAILRQRQAAETFRFAGAAGIIGAVIARTGPPRQPHESGWRWSRWRNLIPVRVPGTRIISLLDSNETARQDPDRSI